MKILFILPQIPYPPHSGGRIVTWNTVKRFAENNEVTVICLYHHQDELTHMDAVRAVCKHAMAFPARPGWSLPTLLRSLVSFWPYKAHRFYNSEMDHYLHELLAHELFDIIHVQNFYPTTYIHSNEPGFKIHYKENVESNLLKRYGENSGNPLVKLAAWFESTRTRAFELNACKKFDQVLTISPLDRDTLLQWQPRLPVRHQRPGVDLQTYPFIDEPEGPPALVFTGTLSYYPNALGIMKFLKYTWPSIRKAVPDCKLWIVGGGTSDELKSYDGKDGIHITGRVDEIQPYINRGLIYIVPLEIGGGIRLKILEAMASGRAIVSTAIGCEGLGLEDKKHLRIAEMPDGFAQAVLDLIQNPQERYQLRRNARQLIEEVYDWDKVIHQQERYYRSLLPPYQARPTRVDPGSG